MQAMYTKMDVRFELSDLKNLRMHFLNVPNYLCLKKLIKPYIHNHYSVIQAMYRKMDTKFQLSDIKNVRKYFLNMSKLIC